MAIDRMQGGAIGGGGRRGRRRRTLDQRVDRMPAELAFDPVLERTLSGYQRDADVATAQAQEQREALFAQTFDPNDPFAKQALLDRNLKEAAQQNSLRFGQRSGGIYSGAMEASQGRQAFDAAQQQDSLFKAYASSMGDVERGLADTLGGLTRSSEDAIFSTTQAQAADWESATPEFGRRRRRRRRGKGGKPGRTDGRPVA